MLFQNKRDENSRQYIANDADLNYFLDLAGRPTTVFVVYRGDPSLSPNSIPSEVEFRALSVESESIQTASSMRRYAQELFRKGVRARDSGTKQRTKTGNAQAVHNTGVEQSLEAAKCNEGTANWKALSIQHLIRSTGAWMSSLWCMCPTLEKRVA